MSRSPSVHKPHGRGKGVKRPFVEDSSERRSIGSKSQPHKLPPRVRVPDHQRLIERFTLPSRLAGTGGRLVLKHQCKCLFNSEMERRGEIERVPGAPYHVHHISRSKRHTLPGQGAQPPRKRRLVESQTMRPPFFGFQLKPNSVHRTGLTPRGPQYKGVHGWMGVQEFKRLGKLAGICSMSKDALVPLLTLVESAMHRLLQMSIEYAHHRSRVVHNNQTVRVRPEDLEHASQLVGRPLLRSDLFLKHKRHDKKHTPRSEPRLEDSEQEESDDEPDQEYTAQDADQNELSSSDSDSEGGDESELVEEETRVFRRSTSTPLDSVPEGDESEEPPSYTGVGRFDASILDD